MKCIEVMYINGVYIKDVHINDMYINVMYVNNLRINDVCINNTNINVIYIDKNHVFYNSLCTHAFKLTQLVDILHSRSILQIIFITYSHET